MYLQGVVKHMMLYRNLDLTALSSVPLMATLFLYMSIIVLNFQRDGKQDSLFSNVTPQYLSTLSMSFRFQDIAGDFESALDIPFNKPSGIFQVYWVYLAKIPYPLELSYHIYTVQSIIFLQWYIKCTCLSEYPQFTR